MCVDGTCALLAAKGARVALAAVALEGQRGDILADALVLGRRDRLALVQVPELVRVAPRQVGLPWDTTQTARSEPKSSAWLVGYQ